MSTISLVMTVMVPGARGTTPSLATVHISDTMPMLELVDLALWGAPHGRQPVRRSYGPRAAQWPAFGALEPGQADPSKETPMILVPGANLGTWS